MAVCNHHSIFHHKWFWVAEAAGQLSFSPVISHGGTWLNRICIPSSASGPAPGSRVPCLEYVRSKEPICASWSHASSTLIGFFCAAVLPHSRSLSSWPFPWKANLTWKHGETWFRIVKDLNSNPMSRLQPSRQNSRDNEVPVYTGAHLSASFKASLISRTLWSVRNFPLISSVAHSEREWV